MNNNSNNNEPSPAAVAASEAMKLDVRVFPVKEPAGNVVASASVTLNDCFAVRGIKVVDGKNGLFVAMPSSKDGRGGFRDTCFPLTAQLRARLTEDVLKGYAAEIGKGFDEKKSIMSKIGEAVKAAKGAPAPETAVTAPGKEKPVKTAAER